jgi:diguanylate cyclase (GGDEF)-like protein
LPVHELPPALIQCLRKRTGTLLGSGGAGRALLGRFGSQEACVLPVLSNGRAEGLLWLDNPSTGHPLDPSLLQELQQVSNELGVALANSRRYRQEQRRADLDALTGLANRGALTAALARAVSDADADRRLVVGLIDIDHFKRFNDAFGHQAGDDVLRIVAQTLRGMTRPSDVLGRYGGEEFLFALRGADGDGAARYAERVRAEVERRGRILSKRFPGHELTISIGFAELCAELSEPGGLIAMADKALYQAKAKGRNRVCRHRPKGGPQRRETAPPGKPETSCKLQK